MKGDAVRIEYTTPGGADAMSTMTVETGGRELTIERDKMYLTVKEATRGGTVKRSVAVRLDAITSIYIEGDIENG